MKPKTRSRCDRHYLFIKELGMELKDHNGRPRGRGYIHAMVRLGFKLNGRRATVKAAHRWLTRHPGFSWQKAYRWQVAHQQVTNKP